MGRDNYSGLDYFFKMSEQASNAGRILDGNMKLAYPHEKYIQMEKELFGLIIDDYERGRWSKLADTFESLLTSFSISANTEWLEHLRNRNVPSDERKNIAAAFINCIQSGLYEKYDLPQTEEEFDFHRVKQQAQNGNVQAMFELSDMYLRGYGCFRDTQYALIWLQKAAWAGHSEAKKLLSKLSESETSKEKIPVKENKPTEKRYSQQEIQRWVDLAREAMKNDDWESAFTYHLKAAQAGRAESMYIVGNMYFWGNGVRENKREAKSWYEKAFPLLREAAIHGDISAMRDIGSMYVKARGTNRDYSEGLKWLRKAAEAGDTDAMVSIGKMYEEGKGVNKDSEIALKFFDKAAQAGNANAKIFAEQLRNPRKSCFITTAVCDSFGKSDDCYELTMFRSFRDNWLANQPEGESLIDEYYQIAPKIVDKINQLNNAREIYQQIWNEYLQPCLSLVESGNYPECKSKYVEMVHKLTKLIH